MGPLSEKKSKFEYKTKVAPMPYWLASIKENRLYDPIKDIVRPTGNILIKGGKVVDPSQRLEAVKDVYIAGGLIKEIADDIKPERGDRVINAEELLVIPGIIDMHLHIHDLFEVTTAPAESAARDGVTVALSPGAGNTLMAPALLGAEVDRGLPIDVGVYVGAGAIYAIRASLEEKIAYFRGELPLERALQVISRNMITVTTGNLVIGIKDHMGHYISSDEQLNEVIEIADKAKLVFMSHTQDPHHAERVVDIAAGRPVHLGHMTAAACGSHGDPVEALERVNELLKRPNVTGEYVTSHLTPWRGNYEGVKIPKEAQEVAFEALKKGLVKVLVSDGQADATMKGFGDSRDNIPAILYLAEQGVLSLIDAVATMTTNVAQLLAEKTGQKWWVEKLGTLKPGARANVTIIHPAEKRQVYTIVNGQIVAFEKRIVRRGYGAGGWVTTRGILQYTGVGDLTLGGYP